MQVNIPYMDSMCKGLTLSSPISKLLVFVVEFPHSITMSYDVHPDDVLQNNQNMFSRMMGLGDFLPGPYLHRLMKFQPLQIPCHYLQKTNLPSSIGVEKWTSLKFNSLPSCKLT